MFDGYISGSVQDCRNSIALAMELLQSFTEPTICVINFNEYLLAIYT